MFSHPPICGNVWRHFWLSQLEGAPAHCWWGPGMLLNELHVQDSPPEQSVQPSVSPVLKLGNLITRQAYWPFRIHHETVEQHGFCKMTKKQLTGLSRGYFGDLSLSLSPTSYLVKLCPYASGLPPTTPFQVYLECLPRTTTVPISKAYQNVKSFPMGGVVGASLPEPFNTGLEQKFLKIILFQQGENRITQQSFSAFNILYFSGHF